MTETEADQLRETVERMHGGTATLAQSVPAGKQPYAVALKGGGLMALAGLWESWRSPAGEHVRSFAIITAEPNELWPRLHNRMPAILPPESWPGMARRGAGGRAASEGAAGPLPLPRHDLLAGQRARRQCPEQRFEPDRTGRRGVNARSAPENLSTWTIIG
jgi:hypothetical protein